MPFLVSVTLTQIDTSYSHSVEHYDMSPNEASYQCSGERNMLV